MWRGLRQRAWCGRGGAAGHGRNRELGRRERQLTELDRQLAHSEKLASVGNLAAGVAHEINNPVGVIQNKVQILRYRIADGEAEERLQRDLDTIEKHVRRIASITEGLLTFARDAPSVSRVIRRSCARRLAPTCPSASGSWF